MPGLVRPSGPVAPVTGTRPVGWAAVGVKARGERVPSANSQRLPLTKGTTCGSHGFAGSTRPRLVPFASTLRKSATPAAGVKVTGPLSGTLTGVAPVAATAAVVALTRRSVPSASLEKSTAPALIFAAVTALPRILALVTALRLILPAVTALALRFLLPTLPAAQTTPPLSARNSAIVATTLA